MVLGLIIGMALAKGLADGVHCARGGMTPDESEKFDEINGARGINPKDVVKIAQRNSVYPNKDGVLPAKPDRQILNYVIRYANSEADVKEFKRQWQRTVQQQLEAKREKTRTSKEARDYDKYENNYKKCVIPNLTDETITLSISHWHFMSFKEHERRMIDILDNTIWGSFVANCSLRPNHFVDNAHIEYYELRLPRNNKMSKSQFKQLYKQCCAKRGWDHQL